jgi:Na+/H+-translocating membrane pyrophosphatase
MMITAMGIVVSFVTTLFATNVTTVTQRNVEVVLKLQLIISTVLMSIAIFPLTYLLPEEFIISETLTVSPVYAYLCTLSGLISGLIIGLVTEFYTSNQFAPV